MNVEVWIGVAAIFISLLAFAGRGPFTRGLDQRGRAYRGIGALLAGGAALIWGFNLETEHKVWVWIAAALLLICFALNTLARTRVLPQASPQGLSPDA